MKISRTTQEFVKNGASSEDKIIAIGSVDFSDDEKSQTVCVDIGKLIDVLNMAKQINDTNVTFRVENDMPLFIVPGIDKGTDVGILLAPRIEE